mgnify:CR=1 FL=1
MKKLISKLQDADKHNDILTPSSSDQSGDEISPVNERTTKKVVAQIEDISTIRQPLILDTVGEIAQEDHVDGNANDGDDDNSSGGTGEEEISNVVLDITDTSNQKVRFAVFTDATTLGSTTKNQTYMTFIRLGDT